MASALHLEHLRALEDPVAWFAALPQEMKDQVMKLHRGFARKCAVAAKRNPGLSPEQVEDLLHKRTEAKLERRKAELKALQDRTEELAEELAARRDCPICLERKPAITDMCRTKCGHNFCKDCWSAHSKSSFHPYSCPMCRANPYTGAPQVAEE